MDRMSFALSSYLLLRLMEDEDDSDYEDDDDDEEEEEEEDDDDDDEVEEKDQQKRRFEHYRKIAEANKATNPRSRQGTSVGSTSAETALRTASQRNHSQRMVCGPDFVPSVNSSTSLVDPLILPGTSQAESILPTRVETESGSVALVYDPAKVIKKEVEEEIEEFGGEEQMQVLSDLNPENVKGVMLRLRAEKLLFELEKLKMDRKKVEAEKRNIILRTKVLELRKKLAGLDSYDESRHPSPPNDKSPEPCLTDFSPPPSEHFLLHTPETVEKDPLSDLNAVVRKVSSPQRKSAVSEGTLAQSKLRKSVSKKPVRQESSVEVCQMRTTSFVAINQTDDILSKSPAEGSDVLDISEDSLGLHGNIDIKKEELCDESLDSNLESLIADKKRKSWCSETQSFPESGERREVNESLTERSVDPTGSGSMYVDIDFSGPVAKRKKFSKGPT